MNLTLLHSPLVGPATWNSLAPILRARGHCAAVPDLTPLMAGEGPYYAALAEGAASGISDDTIVVAHSGAGALVPAIATLAARRLRGAVFVDALLPHPGASWFAGVPPELGTRLRSLAKDGKLPPWHAWWPKGAMEALLPDRAMGAAFLAEQGELPLAYFEELAPALTLDLAIAYLQLSEAYAADADSAAELGAPVLRLNLHHLAPMTHPDAVADGIERLVLTLGGGGRTLPP
ncbi:MAG TPA: hypothetical protein VJ476_10645 [Rhizomicrobium sp.]|nr:hypothetical protein [Rhizomicrobium sp.]